MPFMNRNVYDFFVNREHHRFRREADWNLGEEYAALGLSPAERMVDRFERACHAQTPVIIEGEQIVFFRTIGVLPEIFTDAESKELEKKYTNYLYHVNNITPNYYATISCATGASTTQDIVESALIPCR